MSQRVYNGYIYQQAADGSWQRVGPAQGGMPADPTFPYEGTKAQAEASKATTDARVTNATADAAITKAQADARAAQAAADKAVRDNSTSALTGEARGKLEAQLAGATNLAGRIKEIETRFNRDMSGTGLSGLKEYLPGSVRPANQEFNDAGNAIMGDIAAAYGLSAQQQNTPTELAIRFGPFIPKAGDRDEVIKAKIGRLKEIAQAQAEQARKQLEAAGALPVGMGTAPGGGGQDGGPGPSVFETPHLVGGPTPGAAPAGSTNASEPVPPAYQQAYQAFVAAGHFTPESYAAFRSQLDKQFFPDAADQTETYRKEGASILQGLQNGADINLTVPGVDKKLDTIDMVRNSIANNPVGAAAINFADMGGFGGVRALAGDKLDALQQAQPLGSALGQIGGALTGTAGITKLGSMAMPTRGAALARSLLGKKGANFAKNLATDTAYGAAYGGVSGEGAGQDALLSGLGSAAGQAIGSGVGRVVGGVQLSPAAQTLRDLKIPMTLPQKLGGFYKATEDKAMSLPLVGDMIRARRLEGIDAFNRQAFGDAGKPIGAKVNEIGQEGIQALGDQVSGAYNSATNGVSVPLDNQLLADLQGIAGRAGQFPKDYRTKYAKILENRVAPFADTGNLTGTAYQQALRALKQQRSNAAGVFPGFEDEYRGALSDTMDALTGQMTRGGGADVVSGLNSANAANRNLKTLEDAATRAAGGSETGTPFMFTPSQLQRAGLKTEAKYPGERPFAALADAGQQVLPSRVPDSGTPGRVAQMAVPGLLAGSGAGLGYAAGGDAGSAQTGAGLSTLAVLALLAGGTKGGQKALDAMMVARPEALKKLGLKTRQYKGLFGRAAVPLALDAGG